MSFLHLLLVRLISPYRPADSLRGLRWDQCALNASHRVPEGSEVCLACAIRLVLAPRRR
jgi:hypothetical protein